MNLKNIIQRSGSSIVIIVGIAGSVAVMVSLLAMAEGLNSTISSTGKEDRVIILREGASSELSGLAMSQVDVVANSPGIKSVDGEPLISAEVFSIIDLKKKVLLQHRTYLCAECSLKSFKIRPEIQIIEGEILPQELLK